jgi:hypothetical protein
VVEGAVPLPLLPGRALHGPTGCGCHQGRYFILAEPEPHNNDMAPQHLILLMASVKKLTKVSKRARFLNSKFLYFCPVHFVHSYW